VKRARFWGVWNSAKETALGIPEAHAPVIQSHPVRQGVGPTRVPPGPGAQTPRTRPRTALSCRRSTAGPGWKSRGDPANDGFRNIGVLRKAAPGPGSPEATPS